MHVRLAVADDRTALVDILNEIIAIGGTTAIETPVEPDFFDQFIDTSDPRIFLHVAEAEEGVCGFQWIDPHPEDGVASIATFAQPGTTQRGIGTALFAATLKAAKVAGYHQIDATIRADNTGGLAYYSKMGFEDSAISKDVPLRSGGRVDRVHKRLNLST